jgi:ABC-2 type transport system ATP-binding protein
MQQTFNALLGEVRDSGRTVVISSHVLPEVQHVADRVGLLRDGRLLFEDSVEGVRRRAFGRIRVTLGDVPSPTAFAGIAGVRELERAGARVTFALEGEPDALIKALAAHRVLSLDSTEPDLEDVFLSLYGPGDA